MSIYKKILGPPLYDTEGTITFTSSGTWTVPSRISSVSVTGAGGQGNAGQPGGGGIKG